MGQNIKCDDHSGMVARMEHVERQTEAQWEKINSMITRINISLGGIAVSCILLTINIWLNSKGIK